MARTLDVSIEINGRQKKAGTISGNTEFDAVFRYSGEYLSTDSARAISVSMPLSAEPFTPEVTRRFFEGLLPEGFMRRTIAERNRTDDGDYLSILELLGAECLGALQIKGPDFSDAEPGYRELDHDTLYRLAAEGTVRSADLVVDSHLSLTGASGKIGAYRDDRGRWYLPVGSAPSTHILKQSHVRFDDIVQNEQLAMRTAGLMGIDIPRIGIIEAGDADEEKILFATERYDRIFEGSGDTISGLPCPLRLHQEDMGQALGIAASSKYERPGCRHMKRMFDLLRLRSAAPIEDQMKLWSMIVCHWLIGNTDGHVKNFSLLYDRGLKSVRLAPAYDIVSTVLYDTHSSEMAFSIGGETDWAKINRKCFEEACKEIGLNRRLFMERFDELETGFDTALGEASAEMESEGFGEAVRMAEKIQEIRRR